MQRGITYGLILAFVAALAAALSIRTARIPAGAPPNVLPVHALAQGVAFGSIDAIEQGGVTADLTAQPVRVRASAPLVVKGWAVDPATGVPPEQVVARVDGQPPVSGPVGVYRPDVAAALNDPVASAPGFRLTVSAGSPGRRRLGVYLVSRGRQAAIRPPLVLDVVP